MTSSHMPPLLNSDKYTKIPFVVYYRLRAGKRALRVNYVCFGQMNERGVPDAVRYISPINCVMNDAKPVKEGAHDFYLAFIEQILTRPESPKFSMKKVKDCVHYRLETKGLVYHRALFFLTFFRYVHHYPEIIHHLFDRHDPKDTLEETFKKFLIIHNDVNQGKIIVTSHASANEMVTYNWGGKAEPITLEKFRKNMKRASKTTMRVQECLK